MSTPFVDKPTFCETPCRHHPHSTKCPTIGAGKPLPSLNTFWSHLASALADVFSQQKARYTKVHALFLSWGANSDLDSTAEMNEMRR